MRNSYPMPCAVFKQFEAISAIPHGSGNTKEISRYCVDFAKKHGLDVMSDAAGNVRICKDATPGYENRPTVILQGHLDMVCAKDESSGKNMENDALTLKFGDEYLEAEGTTLGGDDGIAVAYALALLASDCIPHPKLNVILTVDEEIGMLGAAALSPDWLDGAYLLNIDSEEEGVFTVGCAGGVRVHLHLNAETTKSSGKMLTVMVSGLCGGHSGTEIHRPLLNANIAMRRILSGLENVRISAWNGGIRDNVIPTSASVSFLCCADETERISAKIREICEQIKAEYPEETGLTLQIEQQDVQDISAATISETAKILAFLNEIPNGVTQMDENLHMPKTSLNLGILTFSEGSLHLDILVRSGVNTEKDVLAKKLHDAAERFGGTFRDEGDYPAWEYEPNTALEATAVRCYQKLYGEKPCVQTIHAGLECGVLAAKTSGLQCLSIGPDIFDIHTPRERLSLASAARTWSLLLELMKNIGA